MQHTVEKTKLVMIYINKHGTHECAVRFIQERRWEAIHRKRCV